MNLSLERDNEYRGGEKRREVQLIPQYMWPKLSSSRLPDLVMGAVWCVLQLETHLQKAPVLSSSSVQC